MTRLVWVTGAGGFVGGYQLDYLSRLRPECRVVAIDRRPTADGPFDAFYSVDLGDASAVAELARAESPGWVLHLAGRTPPATQAEMWRANVGSSIGLLAGLGLAGVHDTRVVCVGSAAEYASGVRNPIDEVSACGGVSAYGDTKLAQSLTALSLARHYRIHLVVARVFNLVGPGLPDSLVAGSLARQFAARSPTIRVGQLHSTRDFVDVRDAVHAIWLLSVHSTDYGIFNVCTGRGHTIGELIDTLRHITGHGPEVSVDPLRLRGSEPSCAVGDPTRLQSLTGWTHTISLEQSLRDMVEGTGSSGPAGDMA